MQFQGFSQNIQPLNSPMLSKISDPNNNLYVWNLNPLTSEDTLFNVFFKFGKILSCIIKRDFNTGQSRRFGYVTFEDKSHAQAALNAVNNTMVDNFEIKVEKYMPQKISYDEGNLLVKGFGKEITGKELEAFFSRIGKIKSYMIKRDHYGQSLGIANVQFEREEDALKAIKELNDYNWNGKVLSAQPLGNLDKSGNKKTNLHISNFPLSYSDEMINKFIIDEMGKIGKIDLHAVYPREAKHPLNKDQKPGFYAIVNFQNEQKALEVMNKFKGMELEKGTPGLEINIHLNKEQLNEDQLKKSYETTILNSLLIKGILPHVQIEELKSAFELYGKVVSFSLKRSGFLPSSKGQPEGQLMMGFIQYEDQKHAESAFIHAEKNPKIIKMISTADLRGRFINFYQPKNKRKNFLIMKNNFKNALRHEGFSKPNPQQTHQQNSQFTPSDRLAPIPPIKKGDVQVFPLDLRNDIKRMDRTEEVNQFDLFWLKSNKGLFTNMPDAKKKEILGNLMYNRVSKSGISDENLIAKLTGMFIDFEVLDLNEIIEILESNEVLKERIFEGMEVINETNNRL